MPTQPKKYGAISSSVDPSEISTTVLSITKVLAGLLVMGGVLSVADSTTLLNTVPQLITQITVLVPAGYALWHLCQTLFGLGQKILVAIFKSKAPVVVNAPTP